MAGHQFKREKTKFQRDREEFDDELLEQMQTSDPEHYEKYFKEHHEGLKKKR